MKTKLSCEIVRDLLPSYAEKLTSEQSNEAIEAHLADCEGCRALYREMKQDEAEAPAEKAEIDYLKKVRRSKKRLALGILTAMLAIGVGVFVWLQIRAKQPVVRYEDKTGTLIVSGESGYDKLALPEEAERATSLDVQDDDLHLYAELRALQIETRTGQSAREFLPGFIERTDKSFDFLRSWIKENAPDCYPEEIAGKFVNFEVHRNGGYSYSAEGERVMLWVGDYYWHRDIVYTLALLNADSVEWQQIGFAIYLGYGVNPYNDNLNSYDAEALKNERYYDALMRLGCKLDGSAEDNLRMTHAIAYICLRDGLGWGSPYESEPVCRFAYYSGPGQGLGGNALSPAEATSLIAWLTEQYGAEKVCAYCFGRLGFEEAFGTTYAEAEAAWSAWLTETCEGRA